MFASGYGLGAERRKNAVQIATWIRAFDTLSREDRELLLIGISLENDTNPRIHQFGYAEFSQVAHDHRLIHVSTGEASRETADISTIRSAAEGHSGEGASAVGTRPAAVRSTTKGTPSWAAARRLDRSGMNLGEVIEADSRDLPLYFPQFSSVIYDAERRMWYREGWLQPLSQDPTRFSVRFYYPREPMALPIIVATPIRVPAPHLWYLRRENLIALCYTFAPDRTVDRRQHADVASEALRQGVLWLVKYLVWCRFEFWPGDEVGHDPAEIEQSTTPDDPCPAHTWMTYGRCCRPKHLQVLQHRRSIRFGVNPAKAVSR